jgi:hypothetical protein
MMYDYKTERPNLFKEDGVAMLLKIRDNAYRLIDHSGAATVEKMIANVTGSSWTMLAAIDYLAEREEILKMKFPVDRGYWTQVHVYTKGANYGKTT